MNDYYNIGLNYLINKYGRKKLKKTCAFNNKLSKARNKKEYNELIANATDSDYNSTHNDVPEDYSSDHAISMLLRQYNNSSTKIAINNELHHHLIMVKAIEN